MTPGSDAAPHSTFAAFAQRDYRLYAAGFLCSSTGLQMQTIGVLWEVYARTGDPLHVGYIGLARALPVVLLALVAGQIIDMFDRRRILILTQLAFALCSCGLIVASMTAAPLWIFYALLVATGLARAFNGPTRASLLPLLVPDHVLPNAVTWNANLFQVSAIGGPLGAGLLLAATGQAWAVYACTALGTLLLAVMLLAARPRPQAPATHRLSFAEFFAGARYILRERALFGAMVLDMFAVLLGGATALLPIFAEDILAVGPVGMGALKSAEYAGALGMGLVLARRPRFHRAGRAMLLAVACFGLCMITFGLSTSFWLSLAALTLAGAADQVSVVVRHMLVQTRTPDALRGRVTAVNGMFIEVSNELGGFESALVAKFFGPVISAVSGGIGTLVVVAAVASRVPELRKLGDPARPETDQRLA